MKTPTARDVYWTLDAILVYAGAIMAKFDFAYCTELAHKAAEIALKSRRNLCLSGDVIQALAEIDATNKPPTP